MLWKTHVDICLDMYYELTAINLLQFDVDRKYI